MGLFGKKEKVETEHKSNKTFSYKKGEVGLDFTLRTDIPDQLRAFKELLGHALADVETDLESFTR